MNTCISSIRVPALAFLWNGGTISLNPHILPCQLYARVGWTIAHDEKTPGLPGIQVYPSRSKPQKDLRGFVTANAAGHIRTIPVPDWVKAGIDGWMGASGITAGALLRSVNKAGRIWGAGFSPKVIWGVVKEKAKDCEIPSLAPHDLRSYAECRIIPN